MKRILLFSLLLISASFLFAQTELTLTNESSVNSQIEADRAGGSPADVYLVESGVIYYWDAILQVDFDLHIKGPSSEWIGRQANPPVFVPIPDGAGVIYAFANVVSGSYTIENILFSGQNSAEGGDILGTFMTETGASKVMVDNCSFSDYQNSIMEINSGPSGANSGPDVLDTVSITNCLMINGVRKTSSPWGGHIGRFNVPARWTILENNTDVNCGRILGNGGNFYYQNLIENHNSIINSQTNAQELHWWQAVMANNIFYNWSWFGRIPADVAYNYSITTFETFSGLALDSVSVYWGRNLLYRDPAIKEYYDNTPALAAKEVSEYITWNADVDTTIQMDDNTTIGKSYWDIDPEFTVGPGNLDSMFAWLDYKYDDNVSAWANWLVTSPVTYDANGQPVLSWPPAFDLSYSNEYMKVGATDGLPMGDLNWFPGAKETYLANRDANIAALVDSITNATALHIPFDSLSERITAEDLVSVETYSKNIPDQYYLSSNYPNPFNPSTTIRFGLPEQSEVTLSIFNILGQKVYEETAKNLAAGEHSFNFIASQLSSGIYIYNIHAVGVNGKDFTASKKMMLLK